MKKEGHFSCGNQAQLKLLDKICSTQSYFISGRPMREVFDRVLSDLLELTESEYGFIGHVLYTQEGQPYLKTYAVSDLNLHDLPGVTMPDDVMFGIEIHELENLLGVVIESGEPLISNSPSTDPRASNILAGYLDIDSFLGLPLKYGARLVGMVGVANRPGGYDEALLKYLDPLLVMCAGLIQENQNATHRRLAEAALRESEAKYRLLVTHLPDVMMILDRTGKILFINHALPPYDSEEVMGSCAFDYLEGNDRRVFEQRLLDAFGGHVQEQIEVTTQDQSFWSVRMVPIKQDGRIESVMCISTDITSRCQAENAMRNLVEGTSSVVGQDFFRRLVRHLTLALGVRMAFVAELEAREAAWMRSLAVWEGDDHGEDFECQLDLPPGGAIKGNKLCSALGGCKESFPCRKFLPTLHENGILCTALTDSAGKLLGMLAVLHDQPIADRKFAESVLSVFAARVGAELERQRASDLETQRLLEIAHISRISTMGEMATELSHELNQPLTAISGYSAAAGRLLAQGTGHGKEIRAALRDIERQAMRASEIIRRMRRFVSKKAVQRDVHEVNQMINDVISLVNAEARKHDVQLEVDLARQLPEVMIDRILIEQVMVNLIRNAIESLGSSRSADRRIRVRSCLNDAGLIEVEIADNGPGFTREAGQRLFEPFFSTKKDGMGMGLAISKSIMDAHQGYLEASSPPGGGAAFRFSLPVEKEGNHAHGM